MRIQDQAERDRAVGALESNVVVEAGAGTGKTTLLIDRLTVLLLGKSVPIERVVALTFTEKAAAEIRIRLAKRLHDVLDGKPFDALKLVRPPAAPPVVEKRARQALDALDRAQIGTIHAFASHVLRLFPLEADVDPQFQVDEGPESVELFENEWARWLDAELAEGAPRAKPWLEALAEHELEELAGLARALCEPKLPSPFGPHRAAQRKAVKAGLQALAEQAERFSTAYLDKPKPRKIEQAMEAAAARLREGRGEGAESFEISGSVPKGWPDEEFALAKTLAKLAASSGPEAERRIAAAIELVAPFVDRFRTAYAVRGWVSFDGLLAKARDLVRTCRPAREELKAAYDAFLIDEFQDTDPLQGELLLFLAERPGAFASDWPAVELEPGKLFIVGDPKQSIYRFRGADIAAYERFTRLLLEQDAAHCRLTVNFRSRPELLDAVNELFPAVMLPKPGSQAPYVPLVRSPKSQAGGTVELLKIQTSGSADELRESEAEAIADWIEAAAAKGQALNGVALLLRTMTPLRTYLEPLRRRGLPYIVEGEKYFYQSPEVLDFFNLLHAVDDPSNKVALFGVLRSPYGGLTDAEILELAAAGRLEVRRRTSGPASRVFAALASLHEDVGRVPVGKLVERVLSAPYFLESEAAAYQGEQTLANLLKFGRLAAEASDDRGLSLKELIRRLKAWVEDLRQEGESPLADESAEAVRILSMHKAKGLEFPVVILPNLGAAVRGGGEPEPYRLDWGSGLVGLRLGGSIDGAMAVVEAGQPGREDDEETRVLYVAMTRAKERLVLVASGEPKAGSPASRLEAAGLWDGGKSLRVRELGRRESAPIASRAPKPTPIDVEALAAAARARKKAEAAGKSDLFVAPSSEKQIPSPLEGEGGRRPGEGGIVPRADLVGLACHLALERLDWKSPKPDVEAAVRELSIRLPGPGWSEAESEASLILERFLRSKPAAELARAELLGRELPFVHAEGDRIVRGALDLLCRIDGKVYVVDFKTDRVDAGESPARAEAYRPQGERYVEAVRRALGLDAAFRLVFLRPAVPVDLSWSPSPREAGRGLG